MIKYFFETLLKKHIEYRRFDKNRIVFAPGADQEEFNTEFMIAPKDADVPDFGKKDWNYKLPQFTEPYLVHKNSWIVEVGFETFSNEFFSKFLLANPNLQGKLVIHEKSVKKYNQKKNN